MGRTYDALVSAGVPREVADAICASYRSSQEPVGVYLSRISEALWDVSCDVSPVPVQRTKQQIRSAR